MQLKAKDGTYVYDVKYKDGEVGEFTLESGAGVHVWPQGRRGNIPMMPKRGGLRICATNGTEIQNLGRKIVQFRGVKAEAGHTQRELQPPRMQGERSATVLPQGLRERTCQTESCGGNGRHRSHAWMMMWRLGRGLP